MTGGGFLGLVAYGAQNVILSGNPQMSYFYKAFKRYTHFSMESIALPLEGPNQLSQDQPIQLRAKITRNGDLLSDLYFSFNLPAIYSKYSSTRPFQYEFQWARYIGAAMIQRAAFFVGGQKIQEFDGQYLVAKALLDMDQDTFAKWSKLVGDVPELTNPAVGVYAGGTPNRTAYPTVVSDPSLAAGFSQANRPSILGRTLYVPLSFWFTESTGLSLPLVGLQYHECEVQLTLNPAQQLYTVLDERGYRVAPNYRMDPTVPLLDISSNNPEYIANNDTSAFLQAFLTDINQSTSAVTWNFNPQLQATYIFLPDDERSIFASRPLSYLVSQITPYPFPNQIQRQILDLQTHNPIKRLLFLAQRSDTISRNDYTNFTNWWNYPVAPFLAATGLSAPLLAITSGITIPNTQLEIIRAIKVLCNGTEIQEAKAPDFYTKLYPYKYVKGIGQEGLAVYTFELQDNPTQPSGSINSSRIRNFQVDLDLYSLPVNTNYTYNVNIVVENLNWFEVVSGMGGLKYAL